MDSKYRPLVIARLPMTSTVDGVAITFRQDPRSSGDDRLRPCEDPSQQQRQQQQQQHAQQHSACHPHRRVQRHRVRGCQSAGPGSINSGCRSEPRASRISMLRADPRHLQRTSRPTLSSTPLISRISTPCASSPRGTRTPMSMCLSRAQALRAAVPSSMSTRASKRSSRPTI